MKSKKKYKRKNKEDGRDKKCINKFLYIFMKCIDCKTNV